MNSIVYRPGQSSPMKISDDLARLPIHLGDTVSLWAAFWQLIREDRRLEDVWTLLSA
jgi:hypothetical protein